MAALIIYTFPNEVDSAAKLQCAVTQCSGPTKLFAGAVLAGIAHAALAFGLHFAPAGPENPHQTRAKFGAATKVSKSA